MSPAEIRLRLIEIVCGRNPHLKEARHILEIARELEPYILEALFPPPQPPAAEANTKRSKA